MLSPICLFTYKRLAETIKTVDALKLNKLSLESDLIIYSDGAKSLAEMQEVKAVRDYLKTISGFKSITICESEKNKGLANSIISGVSAVIEKHGKVIVLEDDIIVSTDFLEYMNKSLMVFEYRDDIWSIAAYCPSLEFPESYKEDLFLFGRASSHGWATWSNRWKDIDWGVEDFREFKKNRKQIKEFEKTGNDMFRMLDLQVSGKINSWAIRWCYAQFKRKAFTVYPVKSKSFINGYGDNATHKGIFNARHWVDISNESIIINQNLKFNQQLSDVFKQHQDLGLISKIGYDLRKYNLGYKKIIFLVEYFKMKLAYSKSI